MPVLFGSTVTQLVQHAVGTYGYILKIDTSVLLAESISSVVAQASAIETPAPVSGSTIIATLYSYLEDVNCPDLAYNASNSECSIFFKTSEFPFVDDTRYALFGKRKSQNCSNDNDYLDCPDRDLHLLIAYCLELSYAISKGGVPKWVTDKIKTEEKRVRDE
jgi:hypothetical protein